MPNRVGYVSGATGSGGRRGRKCCGSYTCQLCLKAAKWLPVILIVAIVSWSYYAYIVHLCILTVLNENGPIEGVILAVFYHIFLVPFLVSYWQTVWTKPGKVPSAYNLSMADIDTIEAASEPRRALEHLIASKDLAVATRSLQGEVRYCSECSHIKPDRCHHCSMCNDCVLKMDHHCPWVNNCVGFFNQKFFFLFLGYAFFYCMYVMLSTLKYFIAYWSHDGLNLSNGKFHVLFLFFVSGMFAISLLSLFGYHIYLISQNRTTLEAFRPPMFSHGGANRKGFFLGKTNNFREVLGDQPTLWFVPVFTSLGDGLTFPRQCQIHEEDGYSDDGCCYESDLDTGNLAASAGSRTSNSLNNRHNRRFQNGGLRSDVTVEDNLSDDDEEELLLPKSASGASNVWSEREVVLKAETSSDSLETGPAVTYEGFNNSAIISVKAENSPDGKNSKVL